MCMYICVYMYIYVLFGGGGGGAGLRLRIAKLGARGVTYQDLGFSSWA